MSEIISQQNKNEQLIAEVVQQFSQSTEKAIGSISDVLKQQMGLLIQLSDRLKTLEENERLRAQVYGDKKETQKN